VCRSTLGACPDVEVFAQGVRSALDDLARSVLVPALLRWP
jgi:hypothetical protein